MMIHSVYFWLTEEANDQRETFEAALRELVKIPQIQQAHVGTPAKTAERPVTDHSWDYSLVLTFASQAEHDVYQDHPDHDTFIEQCKTLWAKVLVLDSESLA